MMRSNQETKNPYTAHRINHTYITENGFSGKRTNNMTYDTKTRQNQDIYLGVPKKSKEVLEE